jgi:hypothetical protein
MFDTHKLNDNGFTEMKAYKEKLANAVKEATAMMPDCREKSIFITKMEEGVFFGAKAIAAKPGNHTEVTSY